RVLRVDGRRPPQPAGVGRGPRSVRLTHGGPGRRRVLLRRRVVLRLPGQPPAGDAGGLGGAQGLKRRFGGRGAPPRCATRSKSAQTTRRELITPVSKPARWSPPAQRACSILRQRFMTTSRPASEAVWAPASSHRPSWNHSVFGPAARASSATSGRAGGLRNTSTR